MKSILHAARRNPLDHTGDAPTTPPPWMIALIVAALAALMALAFWAQANVVAQREANLRTALAARGLGPAQIELVGWCNGVGPLFAWRTAQASGKACPGPG